MTSDDVMRLEMHVAEVTGQMIHFRLLDLLLTCFFEIDLVWHASERNEWVIFQARAVGVSPAGLWIGGNEIEPPSEDAQQKIGTYIL